MNNVSIKNRCNSVDGSELTMPRAIERMAHHHYDANDRELVQSAAVTLEPMNRPTTGWLPFKESTHSSTGFRVSKDARKGTGSRASTKGQRPDCGVQIRQLRKGKDACHGIGSRWQDHR